MLISCNDSHTATHGACGVLTPKRTPGMARISAFVGACFSAWRRFSARTAALEVTCVVSGSWVVGLKIQAASPTTMTVLTAIQTRNVRGDSY